MKPLLLLHGALGAADQLLPLRQSLVSSIEVHALDFSGHGQSASLPETFSIPAFAEDVLIYMEDHGLKQVDIFGYSMGGYVGLYLAEHHPEKICSLVTLGSKLHWDETTASREAAMLDPETMQEKVPRFVTALQQRHSGKDWKALLVRTAAMMTRLGTHPALSRDAFSQLRASVLFMLGDRDKMVTLEETREAFRSTPNAQLCVLPATPHPIEKINVAVVSAIIKEFLGRGATANQ